MSATMWHYLWQNQQVGPVPEAELRRYLAEGRLSPDTLVWAPGMAQWAPALQLAPFKAPAGQVGAAQAPAGLAPSEIVFLHAERFAAKSGMLTTHVTLLGSEQKVKADELGQAILAVAFLELEHAGAVSLTIGEEKALFGLSKRKNLTVTAGRGQAPWGLDTLEGVLAAIVQQGPLTVSEVVYRLLQEDSVIPAGKPYWLVQDGLIRKGLIGQQEQKNFFGQISYHPLFTDAARQARAASDPTPWLQILGQTQQARPDLWAVLAAGIQSGFARRREVDTASDSGSGSDFSSSGE